MNGRGICSNTSAPYQLRAIDWKLVRGAIGLGEWILSRGELAAADERALRDVLGFLRGLPGSQPGLCAWFSVFVEPELEYDPTAVSRSWSVRIDRGHFEVYSRYDAIIDNSVFGGLNRSLLWSLCPGEPNRHPGLGIDEWIEEVRDPERHVAPRYFIRTEAGYD